MSRLGKRVFGCLAVVALSWSVGAQIPTPTLVTNYDQARKFFSGRGAKMVVSMTLNAYGFYDKVEKRAAKLFLVDFSKNPLTLDLITDSARVICGDPAISPDGSRVVYGGPAPKDCGALYVCRAEKGGPAKMLLASSGYSPSWWIHPPTGAEYVIWVDTPPTGKDGITGTTYIRKMNKGTTEPAEPARVLVDKYALRFGRSPDGKYICTNFPGWHIAELKPDAVENAFLRFVFQGGRACMGNLSRDPVNNLDMLWCWLGHRVVAHDLWNLREFAPFPSPYTAVQYNRWSNNADYATECLLNNPDGSTNEYSSELNAAAAYRISTAQWLVVTKGSRATSLWVESRSPRAAPVFSVEGRTIPYYGSHAWTFTQKATVTLTSADNSPIVYTLNDSLPMSAWTKYTGPITVTSSTAIRARSLAPDSARYDHGSMNRLILQKCPWFNGIIFGTPPEKSSSFVGQTATNNWQYQSAYDGGTGRYFEGRSGGTARAAEIYTGIDAGSARTLKEVQFATHKEVGDVPGSIIQGSNEAFDRGYVDIATIGTTSPISVSAGRAYRYFRVVFDSNCTGIGELKFVLGGVDTTIVQAPTISPHGGVFEGNRQVAISTITTGAVIYYTTDGTTPSATSSKYAVPFTISTTSTVKAIAIRNGVKSTVDSATFTKSSGSAHPVTFSPAGAIFKDSVLVTMSTATTGAKIRYTLDGSNPSATSTLYPGKPIPIKQTCVLKAQASADGMALSVLSIETFVTKADSALGRAGRMVQFPAGVSYHVGDTLLIRWVTHDADVFSSAEIHFSNDGGKTYSMVLESNDINITDNEWGNYRWIIPATLDGKPVSSAQCLIKIVQYNGPEVDRNAHVFTIGALGVRQSYRVEFAPGHAIRVDDRGCIWLTDVSGQRWSAEIVDIRGRVIAAWSGQSGNSSEILPAAAQSGGLYLLKVRLGSDKSQLVPIRVTR